MVNVTVQILIFFFESFQIIIFLCCICETLMNLHSPCCTAPSIDTVDLRISRALRGGVSVRQPAAQRHKESTEVYSMDYTEEQSHHLIIIKDECYEGSI